MAVLAMTHIVGTSRAKWTLCGIRVREDAALPYTLRRYVAAHRTSGRQFCPACIADLEEAP